MPDLWTMENLRATMSDDCRRLNTPELPAALPHAETVPSTEELFQARIIREARMLGFLVYHTHDSRRSAPGYPDLTLTKPGRLIFAELKSATGKLTKEQATWIAILKCSVPEVEVYLWRPADLLTIYDILRTRPKEPSL